MAIVYADDKLVRGSEILALYEEAGWSLLTTRTAASIEGSVRHAYRFLTARDGARLIGFVSALSDRAHYAHITELLVAERYRQRGVRGELLKRLLEALSEAQVVSIFAEPDAAEFYTGFEFLATAGGMILRRT